MRTKRTLLLPSFTATTPQACAYVAGFRENQATVFENVPSGAMFQQIERMAVKVGGKSGAFTLKNVRVEDAQVHVVEASDGTILLFDPKGHRIAVGASVVTGQSMKWFESMGMYNLRCDAARP